MPPRRQGVLARRCVGNVARQLIVNGKPLNAPKQYQHPAHAHLLVNVGRAQSWACAICRFTQIDGGEQRQKYHCEQECQFDVCAECMGAEYSAWHVQKDRFIRGEAIVFSGLKFMGHLSVNADWPDAANQERLLEVIDIARRGGDLPWRAKEHRSLHLFSSHINLTSDPSNMLEWERYIEAKVFARIHASELATVTCINDHPVFIVALVGPVIGCYLLECTTLEAAEGVCDSIQRAYDHVFQSAVLDCIDDSILSAEEGRAPKYAPPAHRTEYTEPELKPRQSTRSTQSQNKSKGGDDDDEPSPPEDQAKHISEYLQLLQRSLGQQEVMQFAGLLRLYREEHDFVTFSQGLLQLFGSHKAELLPNIRRFLPLEDRPIFEEFLATALK